MVHRFVQEAILQKGPVLEILFSPIRWAGKKQSLPGRSSKRRHKIKRNNSECSVNRSNNFC
jgi:hypothetical protein